MIRIVFRKFIKDRALLIFIYCFNLACIIIFYHLIEPANEEVFYPVAIGLFLLTVYLVIDWFRYYPVNRAYELMLRGQASDLHPHTEEQQLFHQLVTKIVREHKSDFNELKKQNTERLYFLSHWMHYLKTPVSVIEILASKEGKTTETAKVFESILQENRRLNTSIEQGLTVFRMESFENDLEVMTIDLVASLRKLINQRKKECIYHSIFPAIEFEENSAYVITDPKWNDILLDQLIANAIKYSSVKKGKKHLIFRLVEDEAGTVLSIKDEGVGIPEYDVERVFQPFFTGENGRKFTNSTWYWFIHMQKNS